MRTRLPVRFKLAVVTAALTFGILCVFAVVIGAVAEQRIRAGFDDDLRATVADLVNKLDVHKEDGQPQYDVSALAGVEAGGAQVRVVQTDGTVVYPSAGLLPLAEVGTEGLSELPGYRVLSRALVLPRRGSGGPFGPLGEPITQPVGYVQYAKPKTTLARTVNRVRLFLGLGVLGGTLLAFLAGLYVAERAMRPIAGLTRAAREVARTRDPDITLPKPRANDEVSDLAHTFEDMLGELAAAWAETETTLKRQRDFVADASHELRTPLTSILANLELLESELTGEQREMAESALRSSKRMRRLVGDLLLLARADAGREAPRAPVDLAAVAREAADEAGALSSDHPVALDMPAPVTISGVADDLHRLAGNLVENALIHTAAGTPVTVSVRREGDTAVLEVADRGPGVPSDLRDRVFERFARGRGGDTTRAGGSGLGLAIVKAVTDAHGGHVELLDAPGGGARFVVSLPAAAEAPVRSDRAASVFGT
ncbi:MAG: two-component system, OmpR family, sensor kinase [Thermoleophilaceae bacterium]|jgi:signal transduction histidine kinase|nr:two-component system, OmpR family, sensor kinase [Thermoleophilaceae bacterium]MEA2454196.1 two-component system, OmpR family, sensor kinase [Thermoleophilaceae bacterium]